MWNGALVAFIAWQAAQGAGARRARGGDYPLSISNIQLLVPLFVSDTNQESGASDESDESGERGTDMPFSNIPSSAFVLEAGPPAPSLAPSDLAYRPRSVYLEGAEPDRGSALDAELRRACAGLARAPAAHELLLLLCGELLDAPPAPAPSPLAPAPHPAGCPCCALAARRDYMPLSGNTDMVMSYMSASRKKKRRPTWWE